MTLCPRGRSRDQQLVGKSQAPPKPSQDPAPRPPSAAGSVTPRLLRAPPRSGKVEARSQVPRLLDSNLGSSRFGLQEGWGDNCATHQPSSGPCPVGDTPQTGPLSRWVRALPLLRGTGPPPLAAPTAPTDLVASEILLRPLAFLREGAGPRTRGNLSPSPTPRTPANLS